MATLRTPEVERAYQEYLLRNTLGLCPLCEREPLASFTNWKIIENKFPYSQIARVHHMLVPLRHVTESELSGAELQEFREIKKTNLDEYDWLMESTLKNQSKPEHFHLHLIVAKA